jgi:hypothetical protein
MRAGIKMKLTLQILLCIFGVISIGVGWKFFLNEKSQIDMKIFRVFVRCGAFFIWSAVAAIFIH